MTNTDLLACMPTHMHTPETYVHSAVAYRELLVLTLGRRVVVWTGNRSQKRRSQERKGHGRRTEGAVRAEAAMLRARPANPVPSPPSGSHHSHSRNSHFPLPCSYSHFYPTPSSTQNPTSPVPRLSHRGPRQHLARRPPETVLQ